MKTTIFTPYEQIVIDNIDLGAYEIDTTTMSLYEKVKNVHDIFKEEYDHEIKRQGELKAFKEYLQGLPSCITIPFYNYDILGFSYAYNLLKVDATEEEEDNFINKYWINVAKAFFTLRNNL